MKNYIDMFKNVKISPKIVGRKKRIKSYLNDNIKHVVY